MTALTVFGAIYCVHKLPLHGLVIELELVEVLENLRLLSVLSSWFYSELFRLLFFVFLDCFLLKNGDLQVLLKDCNLGHDLVLESLVLRLQFYPCLLILCFFRGSFIDCRLP